ncbi:AT-rich interactive domain-containing protein 1-like [Cornus florida]|uniref:AT-rich interactive domain-containing protein 1-like n=1 Tax=Cornus florida TaxID=4283 RepID=UPI002898E256|nr:AT-rich interactive domain-containing protein 1-like [Cornus florida]
MAGWSKLSDGSALDSFKTFQKLQTKKFCVDVELGSKVSVVGDEQKLRHLFDQFISLFLKEIYGSDCSWPLPPMLGEGQSVNLFKLFLLVREKGGYHTVSKNGLWDTVATESGLGSNFAPSVKLIYAKYLDVLDRWLQVCSKDKDSKRVFRDSGSNLGGLLMELESELGGFLLKVSDQAKKDGEYPHLDLEKSELDFRNVGKFCNGDEVWSSAEVGGGKKNVNDIKNVDDDKENTVLDLCMVEEEVSNKKRKRDCHLGMLNWVIEVAKDPGNPEVGSMPERSKWDSYGSEQLWKQVLSAREAMFLKRNVDSSAEQSIWQKKQKMHPSMYDDHTESERLRCSQRIHTVKECRAFFSLKKSQSRACSGSSSSGTQTDSEDDRESDFMTANSVVGLLFDNHRRKRIPVGPYFQAKVPEWNGGTCESDSKWLGTRLWPLEAGEHKKILIERERIGKGRQDSCGCQFSGSVECVRFHVSEKRMKLELELGSAFYRWKFSEMGEKGALCWTREEEKKFQAIVRLNPPSMDKCFWVEMFKSFPGKSRENLVSYYFNVFLLQRRSHQNRCTPSEIDSDDDESELGSLTNLIGHEAVKSSDSILRTPKKPHLSFR